MDCRLSTLLATRFASLRPPRALVTASALCCHVIAFIDALFSVSLVYSNFPLSHFYALLSWSNAESHPLYELSRNAPLQEGKSDSFIFRCLDSSPGSTIPAPSFTSNPRCSLYARCFQSRTTCIGIAQRYKPNTPFLGLPYHSEDDLCSLARSYDT